MKNPETTKKFFAILCAQFLLIAQASVFAAVDPNLKTQQPQSVQAEKPAAQTVVAASKSAVAQIPSGSITEAPPALTAASTTNAAPAPAAAKASVAKIAAAVNVPAPTMPYSDPPEAISSDAGSSYVLLSNTTTVSATSKTNTKIYGQRALTLGVCTADKYKFSVTRNTATVPNKVTQVIKADLGTYYTSRKYDYVYNNNGGLGYQKTAYMSMRWAGPVATGDTCSRTITTYNNFNAVISSISQPNMCPNY